MRNRFQRIDLDTAMEMDEIETFMFIFHTVEEFRQYNETGVIKPAKGMIRAVFEAFDWYRVNKTLYEEGRVFVTVHSKVELELLGFEEVEFVEGLAGNNHPLKKSEDDIPEWRAFREVATEAQGYFIINTEDNNESNQSGTGQGNSDSRWRKDLHGYRREIYEK